MKRIRKEVETLSNGKRTLVTLYTSIGTFYGESSFNEEKDLGKPSRIIGGSIAEDRAFIAYLNEKIRLKKAELRGLKRFIGSYYKDSCTQAKARHLLQSMNEEYEELLYERQEREENIKAAIKSRETYNRLKNIDRSARDAQMRFIQEGIAALKTAPSEKDKID